MPASMSLPMTVALLALLASSMLADAAIPPYERGKGAYQYILSKSDLANGISILGSHERLKVAMDKVKKGQLIKIATVGGSITGGQGAVDAPSWPQYVFNYMNDTFGADRVKCSNGAVGGTVSGYMSVCHNMHVPKDVDIVFLEYSVNDWHSIHPYFENSPRKAFERLIRKLLKYPNKPAVVLMHAYIWYQNYPHQGAFWSNTEREFNEFALYYHLPSLSLKSAVFQRMLANEEGFQTGVPRMKDEVGLKEKAFYWDPIHPDGRTGARCMGELGINLLQLVYDELERSPVTDGERAAVAADLFPPMIPNNFESLSDKCFIGAHFTDTVKTKDGWEWINESKTPRPKWGYVTKTVGKSITMQIDTRASSAGSGSSAKSGASSDVLVELAFLKSYEHMGKAKVTCGGGCKCSETVMDGHQLERNSQLNLHNFYASQAEKCDVTVTVVPETSSGEHKFKLAGIMISEEVGQHEGIRNNAAVEYVGDISQRSKDGTFDSKNHA